MTGRLNRPHHLPGLLVVRSEQQLSWLDAETRSDTGKRKVYRVTQRIRTPSVPPAVVNVREEGLAEVDWQELGGVGGLVLILGQQLRPT